MYRFRAVAYNDAGHSEPGDPSDPVVIDVPGVQIAPYFVLMLNDTIALEHERVEFKVKVLGTPKPSIQWFKDDMEVRHYAQIFEVLLLVAMITDYCFYCFNQV